MKVWNIEVMTGYKPVTTFYEDFSIADAFGESAIVDTFDRAFQGWKNNYVYLTELIMVLNWKVWEHYETNAKYSVLYSDLWAQVDEYALQNLKGEELSYFLRVTD